MSQSDPSSFKRGIADVFKVFVTDKQVITLKFAGFCGHLDLFTLIGVNKPAESKKIPHAFVKGKSKLLTFPT